MKHDEQERKHNETWWKIVEKHGNMMKNRGKNNNETWWTRKKKIRKNDEKEWTKTMKHYEK